MDTPIAGFFENCDLTASQKAALEQLELFFKSDKPCFLLKGYAGTGKTFLIRGVVRYLQSRGMNVVLAAPTGRAAKILSQKADYSATTIHRLMYAGESLKDKDNSRGKQYDVFKVTFGTGVNRYPVNSIFIVDEASMVSNAFSESDLMKFGSGYLLSDLCNFLWPDRSDTRRKLIFTGDTAQLPPVDMKNSPALDESYLKSALDVDCMLSELTDVVRQKEDSLILGNATDLREAIRRDRFTTLNLKLNSRDVCLVEEANLVESYLAMAGKSYEEAVVIAYSNAQVAAYNQAIRNRIFPGMKEPMPGDRLVVVSNNYLSGRALLNGETGTLIQVNNQLIHKREVKIKRPGKQGRSKPEVEVLLSFREAVIRFAGADGDSDVQCMILDNALFSNKREISYNEQVALLVDFKNRFRERKPGMDNDFRAALRNDPFYNALRVKYGYALTCHKAQGGEWKHVFVQCTSQAGYFHATYFRWLYTAITRASEQLLLMNPPTFHIASALKPVGYACAKPLRAGEAVSGDENASSSVNPKERASQLFADIGLKLNESGLVVVSRKMINYGIQYAVKGAQGDALLRIFYNGAAVITKLEILNTSGVIVPELLSALAYLNLPDDKLSIQQTKTEPKPVEAPLKGSFVEDFQSRLASVIEPAGVVLTKTEEFKYQLICYFEKGLKYAVIKFYYNGKGQFTRYELIANRSHGLEDEMTSLMKELIS